MNSPLANPPPVSEQGIPTLIKEHRSGQFTDIAPIPTSIAQTNLSLQLLKDLLLKHVFDMTVASIRELSGSMALSGAIVDELIQLLRADALLQLSSSGQQRDELTFRLTERGRLEARDALSRSGYSGAAPIALCDYYRVVNHYSLLKHQISRVQVKCLFNSFVIDQGLLDQLGAAFNSHRAIFVYGHAGTGKTYTISKLSSLFGDNCLIPYAVASGDSIIQLYDPQVHRKLELNKARTTSLRYAEAYDSRYVPCQRPIVVVGGELTLDQLEVSYEADTRLYQAPLQLKANCGLFIIDDMGRQSVSPKAIFNRWIVPMEDRRDFLTLSNGQHFETPFDVQLVFSSNINPLELADEALLRRIGFKIKFHHVSDKAYTEIWRQELDKAGLEFDLEICRYLIEDLHHKQGVDLAPCHPRDLINTALSQIHYLATEPVVTKELLDWSWNNYFVQLDV
ncbi:MAG: AAA family ATPase [Moraxellaceae bacterium]|nr:MAG: AAA family ATPase [Moraxellaceae bacterium]